ncbi:MAG: BrnT family toxin [Pseudonocardiaceae bacterium]|nr:BrnT family toxin [Pseudonocardiaceae bacterium]
MRRVEFEFDPNRSQANRDKHGIDFVRAQDRWYDPSRVQIPVRTVDEPRWLIIGLVEGKHWSAVITMRQDSIRIISVRRSRVEEIAIYEG